MSTRAFVGLITCATDQAPTAIPVCASDRISALACARETARARGMDPSDIVAILTQEDVTCMGMLLAAARVALATGPMDDVRPTSG